ncbi:MAG: hypothetical protein A3I05_02730 [Deltaproteobacteria bacterium RIFCSPLOWO2_02_FULL_44_10]|nr:MAG: hypothetical protein A3C46_03395 [Deltaproteobacteria bacterium RIFCSPHIGHO2_02_FULL_44_16]OGQ46533.1 MAG: hypothetical protein A3I05_02730 [Deltaproteobacteria bacterium RIFCSPLOWO2_02_FULL_44_10]
MSEQNMKDVFQVLDGQGKEGKAKWIRIGAAFVNRDGSLNAFLDAFPRDGKIHIRDRKPTQKEES